MCNFQNIGHGDHWRAEEHREAGQGSDAKEHEPTDQCTDRSAVGDAQHGDERGDEDKHPPLGQESLSIHRVHAPEPMHATIARAGQ